jgi:ATP-dependent Clp endopeptidase proteolytic subunit ClpP
MRSLTIKNMKKWIYKANNEMEDPSQGGGVPIFLNMGPSNNEQWTLGGIKAIENKILFYSDIDSSSIVELNKLLIEVDIKLQNTKNTLGDDYNPVCHLHINSNGGEIFSAFAAVDTIRQMKSKVYTYVEGAVASAGTLLSLAGDKRYMGKYSHLLIHQLSGGMYGKFNEMEDEIYNCTALMKLLKTFYKEKTKMPMKKLEEILTKDIWLSADECLQYGIVDQII